MNPPVSNAIQGAYLVAVVMTGFVLGGASTVFSEMTEGLGCLLGGFCFSMWLLVLQPGGLVKSTGGKAVFIAAFTVVAYATSFSHYTRDHGLIVSTSFGGATAVVRLSELHLGRNRDMYRIVPALLASLPYSEFLG